MAVKREPLRTDRRSLWAATDTRDRWRTVLSRLRKPMLYPLSYEGKRALTCGFACSTVHVTA
jgi:hypothetical protein